MSSRNKLFAVLFGQLITLAASSMNAASFTLSNHNRVNTHLFQLCIVYALLSMHLIFCQRDSKILDSQGSHYLPCTRRRLSMPWWAYLILSILDVLPNFMQLISFHYTSLSSTTLLGSLTVPSTMFFSARILARSFGTYHCVGVLLTVLGSALTIWVDHKKDSSSAHSNIGDVLAVLAALLNGFQDVVAEYCIKNVDKSEYLGMLGLFGALFTGIVFPWLEREALFDFVYDRTPSEQWEIVIVVFWYVASVLAYYLGEAFFLVSSDATLLNLSMQTSNLWAISFSFFAYNILPPMLFYPALILVISGVAIYELKPTMGPKNTNEPEAKTHLISDTMSYIRSYDSLEKTEMLVV